MKGRVDDGGPWLDSGCAMVVPIGGSSRSCDSGLCNCLGGTLLVVSFGLMTMVVKDTMLR